MGVALRLILLISFRWTNEAKGVAGVHCVIVWFSYQNPNADKWLFRYSDVSGVGEKHKAKRINQYLLDAPSVILPSRSQPKAGMPTMTKGSQPTDDVFLILNADEKEQLLTANPILTPYIKRSVGGNEFLNNLKRYCLWFVDTPINDLKKITQLPIIKEKIAGVTATRQKSPTKSVQEWADKPLLFTQNRQPVGIFGGARSIQRTADLFADWVFEW